MLRISALIPENIQAEQSEQVNYLVHHRLQWGKPDTLSLLPSLLDNPTPGANVNGITSKVFDKNFPPELPPIPHNAPAYFTADTPAQLVSVIMNDWPYSGEYLSSYIYRCNVIITLDH